MKDIVKHLIMLLMASLLLSSCGIFYIADASKKNIGDRCILKLKVFQTLSISEALCTQEGSYSLDVFKIVTETNTLYDGKIIEGTWVLIDTYPYKTENNRIKTAPVLMPLSEYKAALKE